MNGKSSQIKFNTCATCGGGQKPDTFGMVSPTRGVPESELTMSQFVRNEERAAAAAATKH